MMKCRCAATTFARATSPARTSAIRRGKSSDSRRNTRGTRNMSAASTAIGSCRRLELGAVPGVRAHAEELKRRTLWQWHVVQEALPVCSRHRTQHDSGEHQAEPRVHEEEAATAREELPPFSVC